MRRLALLVVTVLVTTGSHFPQGWHWPRLWSTGSDAKQTLVYFQNDVVSYQGPYVQWLANRLSDHHELSVRMVDTCPAGRNCVVWRTANINGAVTAVATGSDPHLVGATVTLDDGIGLTENVTVSKGYVWHEGCHAFGGGFTPPGGTDIHYLCNPEYRAHHFAHITRVYHNDPG